jgi:hypothetical protein
LSDPGDKKARFPIIPKSRWVAEVSVSVGIEDLKRLNEILDELEQDLFFEHYKKLKAFYEYLAHTYQFNLKTHTVDPATGKVVPISDTDKVYFDKMTI